MIDSDPMLAYRPLFPILARTNYLISNSLGAVPAGVASELQAYYETWADRGVRAWEESWWTMAADLGDLVSPLIGADQGEVVFQPNVTLAHGVVLSGFRFNGDRSRIVTDAMHFPSILYLLDGYRESGAEIVTIPSHDGISVETDRILDAIDERTACVCLSHVLFKSAYIHDIKAIAAKAREHEVPTIIDGYQSVGVIEVDVKDLGVDVYIGGCLKWLCGGPGAAFVWVKPEFRPRLAPRLTGWMASRHPFGFEPDLDRRDDAWRYLHGTPSISALHTARPGLKLIGEIGPKAIRAKSVRQVGRLTETAESRGFPCRVSSDPDRRAGTVALDVPHGYEVSKALKDRQILCDFRPGTGIRLSPHFYTRDDEIDEAIEAIAGILADQSWTRFAGSKATVT